MVAAHVPSPEEGETYTSIQTVGSHFGDDLRSSQLADNVIFDSVQFRSEWTPSSPLNHASGQATLAG